MFGLQIIKISCLFVVIFSTLTFAQFPNIRVSDAGSQDPEEVTIAINPANPKNLAAGANLNYYYYSFDGGWTWTEGRLSSQYGVWGDPCVIFDDDGKLLFAHLSSPPSSEGDWLDRIVIQKSYNGGRNWNRGEGIGLNPPKDQDKEWLAVDLTNSPFHNRVYWHGPNLIGMAAVLPMIAPAYFLPTLSPLAGQTR